ncbi:DNA cytosine methyltransferase [Microbulbifer sp. ZKSA006]|uniref:DNA cytosine methyltransferase n=1 Tax=Microbulbifer sp. ZKSA006 TaxID=3243390 RepID=UPI00403915E8
MSLRSIELFAGAGGLGVGLHQAGFNTLAAFERNSGACATLIGNRLMGAECEVVEADIRTCDYSVYDAVDLVSGGPPCQPFSLGGKHSAYNDDRDMFPEAVRAIRELRPKAFILENVKGLLRKSFSEYFEYILLQLQYPNIVRESVESWQCHLARLERLHTEGHKSSSEYNVAFRLLNSADFGVPQKRERVVIVGFRKDLGVEWSFPEVTHTQDRLLWDQMVSLDYWNRHKVSPPLLSDREQRKRVSLIKRYGESPPSAKPWHTVRDAIYDLPKPYLKEGRGKYLNHVFKEGAWVYPGHTGSYIDAPSKTLKAGVHGVPGGENMIRFENGAVRYFTVRESARIQTFPDEYEITGVWSEAMRQLGNAVPVQLARMVGESVFDALRRASSS